VPSHRRTHSGQPGLGRFLRRAERGSAYARAHCARCRAIGSSSESPFKPAPPFHTLRLRYPIETLGEVFTEGIVAGHAAMPQFELEPDQIHDLLTYLKTLE
jgi:mono/diheme cytochrome c family protein